MSHEFQNDIDAIAQIAAVPMILDVLCRSTSMGFAAVARVTDGRWVVCQVLDNIDFGLPVGGELKVETTLCHEVRQHHQIVVIDNVADDPIYFNHPTPALYGLQSYISVPILLPDGRFFGTLCAIDPKPAKLNNPQTLGMFKLFAELIAHHLDSNEKLATARTTAELREQFIAVLGHDLRNPLAALEAGTSKLQRDGWTEKTPRVLTLMRSSISRMSGLVDNVMDLARARLGGGIDLKIDRAQCLETTLTQVIEELRASYPDRTIETHFQFDRTIGVDHARMAQMFSNLLGNALTHGAAGEPIYVVGKTAGERFELVVRNAGEPIPAATLERLFMPFYRGEGQSTQQGLGLGLYIAAEIAKAHGGQLDVVSDRAETRFTFTMPADAPDGQLQA